MVKPILFNFVSFREIYLGIRHNTILSISFFINNVIYKEAIENYIIIYFHKNNYNKFLANKADP